MMRAVLSLLALCVLALLLYESQGEGTSTGAPRQAAKDMDVHLLSQARRGQGPCPWRNQLIPPGIQLGARYWHCGKRRLGGLVAARIGSDGSWQGEHYFELRKGEQDRSELERLQALIEGTPVGSHLGMLSLGSLAEGEFARTELALILDRLGAREAPIGSPKTSWSLLTSRLADGTWLARGELTDAQGCAELWVTLPR